MEVSQEWKGSVRDCQSDSAASAQTAPGSPDIGGRRPHHLVRFSVVSDSDEDLAGPADPITDQHSRGGPIVGLGALDSLELARDQMRQRMQWHEMRLSSAFCPLSPEDSARARNLVTFYREQAEELEERRKRCLQRVGLESTARLSEACALSITEPYHVAWSTAEAAANKRGYLVKASAPDIEIEFVKPWGKKSWIVKYSGPYDNSRPCHVELRRGLDTDSALYDSMTTGRRFTLSNLRKIGQTVIWDVDKLILDNGVKAHFTVHYGPCPASQFLTTGMTCAEF
jgi:hypothetical protein